MSNTSSIDLRVDLTNAGRAAGWGARGGQMTVAVVVALAAAAAAETLYNGIVLPREWPPRIDLTNATSISDPW